MTDPSNDVDGFVELYNVTRLDLLNKHVPEREKVFPDCTNFAWIGEAGSRMKQARQQAE